MTPTAQLRHIRRVLIGELLEPRPIDTLTDCVYLSPEELRTPEGLRRLSEAAQSLGTLQTTIEHMVWSAGRQRAAGSLERLLDSLPPGETLRRACKMLVHPPTAHQPRPRAAPRLDEACDFLVGALRDGPRLATQVAELARGRGIGQRTLKRARAKLDVLSIRRRRPTDGEFIWTLCLLGDTSRGPHPR